MLSYRHKKHTDNIPMEDFDTINARGCCKIAFFQAIENFRTHRANQAECWKLKGRFQKISTAKLSICEKAGAQLFEFSVWKNSTLFWEEKDGIFAFRVAIWKRTSGGQKRGKGERVLLKCWSFPASGSVWIYDCSWARRMPPLPEWIDSSGEALLSRKEDRQPLLGKSISFFRGGYFATASMIYPRASCRVVLK